MDSVDPALSAGRPRLEAELLHRLFEELGDRFGIDPLALAAHAEARVVHLPASSLADAPEHAVGPQRQRGAESLLEHVLHRAREPQEHRARVRRPRLAGRAQDVAHVLVVQAGDDGRHHHADTHAGARESLDRAHPSGRGRDEGLDRASFRLVPEGHAHHDGEASASRELLKDVDVALDERSLGDDAHGIAILGAHLEAAARQAVARLEGLIAIGHAAEDDLLALPLRAVERLAQQLRGSLLDDDLPVEVGPRAEAEVLVRGSGVAIGAGVKAPTVGVHAPVEADVRAVVVREDAAALVLVDLELRQGRLAVEILDVGRRPRIGRVRERAKRARHPLRVG